MVVRLLTGFAVVLVTFFSNATAFAIQSANPVRVGMIGLDTSHVVAFTRIMNDPNATGALKDVQIVAAWPGGNPDFPLSRRKRSKSSPSWKRPRRANEGVACR